jgi:hypothetical protein
MDLQPYLTASGERILKGVTGKVHGGKGEIFIAKAAVIGIDHHLMALLMAVVDELGIAMSLNSIDTGTEHVPSSRHFSGRAVDCSMIGAKGGPLMPATLLNRYAVRYAQYLGQHGFRPYEQGPWPAVLLGPARTSLNQTGAPHIHHLHTSIAAGRPSAAAEEDGHGAESEESFSAKDEGKAGGVLKQRLNRADCLYPALQAAAYLRGAFPPPFPQPQLRCIP